MTRHLHRAPLPPTDRYTAIATVTAFILVALAAMTAWSWLVFSGWTAPIESNTIQPGPVSDTVVAGRTLGDPMTGQSETALNIPVAVIYADGAAVCREAVTLDWHLSDPALVRMTFTVPGSADVEWLVARELLMNGVGSSAPIGLGNVTVRADGDRATRIHLSAPAGDVGVLISTGMLVRFLDGCEDICPCEGPVEAERLAAWVDAFLLTLDGAA